MSFGKKLIKSAGVLTLSAILACSTVGANDTNAGTKPNGATPKVKSSQSSPGAKPSGRVPKKKKKVFTYPKFKKAVRVYDDKLAKFKGKFEKLYSNTDKEDDPKLWQTVSYLLQTVDVNNSEEMNMLNQRTDSYLKTLSSDPALSKYEKSELIKKLEKVALNLKGKDEARLAVVQQYLNQLEPEVVKQQKPKEQKPVQPEPEQPKSEQTVLETKIETEKGFEDLKALIIEYKDVFNIGENILNFIFDQAKSNSGYFAVDKASLPLPNNKTVEVEVLNLYIKNAEGKYVLGNGGVEVLRFSEQDKQVKYNEFKKEVAALDVKEENEYKKKEPVEDLDEVVNEKQDEDPSKDKDNFFRKVTQFYDNNEKECQTTAGVFMLGHLTKAYDDKKSQDLIALLGGVAGGLGTKLIFKGNKDLQDNPWVKLGVNLGVYGILKNVAPDLEYDPGESTTTTTSGYTGAANRFLKGRRNPGQTE